MKNSWKLMLAVLLAAVGIVLTIRSCARSTGPSRRQFTQKIIKPGDKLHKEIADLLAEAARQPEASLPGWVAGKMRRDATDEDRAGVVFTLGQTLGAGKCEIESAAAYGSELIKVVARSSSKPGEAKKIALIVTEEEDGLRFYCAP